MCSWHFVSFSHGIKRGSEYCFIILVLYASLKFCYCDNPTSHQCVGMTNFILHQYLFFQDLPGAASPPPPPPTACFNFLQLWGAPLLPLCNAQQHTQHNSTFSMNNLFFKILWSFNSMNTLHTQNHAKWTCAESHKVCLKNWKIQPVLINRTAARALILHFHNWPAITCVTMQLKRGQSTRTLKCSYCLFMDNVRKQEIK